MTVRTIVTGYFDGLCEPHQYALGCGGWLVEPLEIRGHRSYGMGVTSNAAEYLAAIDCLRAIYRTGFRWNVILKGDSQLVVRQFSGRYQCRAEHLQKLLATLKKGASFFESVTLEWIPRIENDYADRLSRVAYEESRDAHGLPPL